MSVALFVSHISQIGRFFMWPPFSLRYSFSSSARLDDTRLSEVLRLRGERFNSVPRSEYASR